MRTWLYLLGGPLIWALHFAAIYAFVSLAAQTRAADTGAWQAASVAVSIACAAGALTVLVIACRRIRGKPRPSMADHVAAVGALVSGIGVAFQAAAPLFSPAG